MAAPVFYPSLTSDLHIRYYYAIYQAVEAIHPPLRQDHAEAVYEHALSVLYNAHVNYDFCKVVQPQFFEDETGDDDATATEERPAKRRRMGLRLVVQWDGDMTYTAEPRRVDSVGPLELVPADFKELVAKSVAQLSIESTRVKPVPNPIPSDTSAMCEACGQEGPTCCLRARSRSGIRSAIEQHYTVDELFGCPAECTYSKAGAEAIDVTVKVMVPGFAPFISKTRRRFQRRNGWYFHVLQ